MGCFGSQRNRSSRRTSWGGYSSLPKITAPLAIPSSTFDDSRRGRLSQKASAGVPPLNFPGTGYTAQLPGEYAGASGGIPYPKVQNRGDEASCNRHHLPFGRASGKGRKENRGIIK